MKPTPLLQRRKLEKVQVACHAPIEVRAALGGKLLPLGRRSLRSRARHGLGAGEHALPASAGQRGRCRAGRPVADPGGQPGVV